MPDFANPTGLSLTLDERLSALSLARELGAALIQDAAYENLLKSRRQVLHRRVAEILRNPARVASRIFDINDATRFG